MKTTRFGIEIEFTGITRRQAATVAANYFGSTVSHASSYDRYTAGDGFGRTWTFMSDASIHPMRKENGRKIGAGDEYKVEMVTPILTYEQDMDALQELIRRLRKAGAFTDPQHCGIHIHLDGAPHTARSIRNWVNIIASRNDLLYKALQIEPARKRWCKELDADLVRSMNARRPKTLAQIEEIWYEGYGEPRGNHYHSSRYAFLNLHSFFHGNGTVELRGFNATLHAGKVRAYVALALAMNQQALTQTKASARKSQTENEKFAMRTYLTRIGLNGDEFANCREHLCKHLDGNAAWRFGQQGA